MNEEEKAIEYLKQQRAYGHKFNNRQIISITNVALKLIKTQKAELEKKDKIINMLKDELGYTRKVVEGEKKDE